MAELYLSPAHRAMLLESAISEDVITARGYRTVTDAADLERLGFAPAQRRVPGLLLPLYTTDGGNGLYVYRPDNPRVMVDKSKREADGSHPNRALKYEFPKGAAMRLDVPPLALPHVGDPSIPLYITEGQKKGDAILSAALAAGRRVGVIVLLGVYNWRGSNELGGSTVLADFEFVALKGRDVRLVFDSDAQTNHNVKAALDRLSAMLRNRGASVSVIYLPGGAAGKVGADDYLASGKTFADLEVLAQAPVPQPVAAAPAVELLDGAPVVMSRPLRLVEGRSYLATWLHIRRTVTEVFDEKRGVVVKLSRPRVETALQLFVLRDDGVVFGDGGDADLEDLGLDVKLAEAPPADKLLSAPGLKRYKAGHRPQPVDVFRRMVDVVQRFIDFDRSLAAQDVMAEFVACYALSTWFVDAFQVVGFLWPSGERGAGKTNLLHVVTQLSYLGSVIMSGGSFATLRDLADYGSTLAFDDAEELTDPRKSDPDKRSLLLAGNRRGAFVTIKEPDPNGKTWRTRYVNAFCPRLFSAIRLPDPVLASRTVIVPLVRTADAARANVDPVDGNAWPHDRRALVDDLWLLALHRLAELPAHDAAVASKAILTGRNFQPWRAVLAVGSWLQANGVPGLLGRLEALALSYQTERADLESSDWTVLAIRALCRCAINAVSAGTNETPRPFAVKTAAVADAMKAIAEESEADVDGDKITSRSVGRLLGKLRLKQERTSKLKGWSFTANELSRLAGSYSLPFPPELGGIVAAQPQKAQPLITSGINGTNGTTAQSDNLLEGSL